MIQIIMKAIRLSAAECSMWYSKVRLLAIDYLFLSEKSCHMCVLFSIHCWILHLEFIEIMRKRWGLLQN